jgi:hypothetical protein
MDSLIAVGSNLKTKGPGGFPIAPKYASHSLPLGSIGVITENIGNALKSARIDGLPKAAFPRACGSRASRAQSKGLVCWANEDPPAVFALYGSTISTGEPSDRHKTLW